LEKLPVRIHVCKDALFTIFVWEKYLLGSLLGKIFCSKRSFVQKDPLFKKILCSKKSSVQKVPLFKTILCSKRSAVQKDPLFIQKDHLLGS
jgi:hypothetical protein